MSTRVIMAMGKINDETCRYELTVGPMPTVEKTKRLAQVMATKIAEALTEVMGDAPVEASTNGSVEPATREAMAKAFGVTVEPKGLEDFLMAMGAPEEAAKEIADVINKADDCQCPNCVSRRRMEAMDREKNPDPNLRH